MTEGGLKRRTQPIDSCLLPTMTHAVCRRQSEADSLEGSEAARVSCELERCRQPLNFDLPGRYPAN